MGNDQKNKNTLIWVYQAVRIRIDFCKKTIQMSATAEVKFIQLRSIKGDGCIDEM